MGKLFTWIKTKHIENTVFSRECAVMNTNRLFIASLLSMVANITSISLFLAFKTDEEIWKHVIIATHATLFIVMAVCFLITLKIRHRKTPSFLSYFIQYIALTSILFTGMMIVAIDQWVTRSIAAYIVSCMIAGVALILRPAASFIIFASSYILYFFLLRIVTPNAEILMAHSVNGLCSAAIGFFLSCTVWHNFRINTIQRKKIAQQQKSLEQANKELETIAYLDPLTSLPNRRHFDDAVSKETARAIRMEYDASLVMLDIDHFKKINDVYGHPVGDSLLIQFSELLTKNKRKYDVLSRLAGDEFIILLPQTDQKQAITVAELLRRKIEEHVFLADDEQIHITASFGVSRLILDEGITLIKQYAMADDALYQAKHNNKNCVMF